MNRKDIHVRMSAETIKSHGSLTAIVLSLVALRLFKICCEKSALYHLGGWKRQLLQVVSRHDMDLNVGILRACLRTPTTSQLAIPSQCEDAYHHQQQSPLHSCNFRQFSSTHSTIQSHRSNKTDQAEEKGEKKLTHSSRQGYRDTASHPQYPRAHRAVSADCLPTRPPARPGSPSGRLRVLRGRSLARRCLS